MLTDYHGWRSRDGKPLYLILDKMYGLASMFFTSLLLQENIKKKYRSIYILQIKGQFSVVITDNSIKVINNRSAIGNGSFKNT